MSARSAGIPAVFFDRDGVLIEAPVVDGLPKSAATISDISVVPEAISLCRKLKTIQIPTFMITNQPDIARGRVNLDTVREQNCYIAELCNLTSIKVCPHDDEDRCHCRKPQPGMILELARDFKIDLSLSVVVGDRWRDIEAAIAAGTNSIFLDLDYKEPKPVGATVRVRTLKDADAYLMSMFSSD